MVDSRLFKPLAHTKMKSEIKKKDHNVDKNFTKKVSEIFI